MLEAVFETGSREFNSLDEKKGEVLLQTVEELFSRYLLLRISLFAYLSDDPSSKRTATDCLCASAMGAIPVHS